MVPGTPSHGSEIVIQEHECTVYCEGGRYNVEADCHTLQTWVSPLVTQESLEDDWRKLAASEGWVFIRARREVDAKPIGGHVITTKGEEKPTGSFPDNSVAWLVTVRGAALNLQ
jgi:hypothetical protein